MILRVFPTLKWPNASLIRVCDIDPVEPETSWRLSRQSQSWSSLRNSRSQSGLQDRNILERIYQHQFGFPKPMFEGYEQDRICLWDPDYYWNGWLAGTATDGRSPDPWFWWSISGRKMETRHLHFQTSLFRGVPFEVHDSLLWRWILSGSCRHRSFASMWHSPTFLPFWNYPITPVPLPLSHPCRCFCCDHPSAGTDCCMCTESFSCILNIAVGRYQ